MSDIILTDFPKLQCPFIRQTFKVDKNEWMAKRDSLKIRAPEVYLVAEGKIWMAKLRRDIFGWYYSDNIEIIGYSKQGTGDIENQDKFD